MITTTRISIALALAASFAIADTAQAGDKWGFSIGPNGAGVYYKGNDGRFGFSSGYHGARFSYHSPGSRGYYYSRHGSRSYGHHGHYRSYHGHYGHHSYGHYRSYRSYSYAPRYVYPTTRYVYTPPRVVVVPSAPRTVVREVHHHHYSAPRAGSPHGGTLR